MHTSPLLCSVHPFLVSSHTSALLRLSFINITRVEDGASFTSFGTDNDNPKNTQASTAAPLYRTLSASLLSGYTYRVTVIPAPTNPRFYPAVST